MTTQSTEAQHRLNTRLLQAAESHSAEAVAELVRQGAALDCRDTSHGFTPLHAAASGGNLATLHALLDLGADATALDHQGNTPLMYAAYSDKPQCISALLHRFPDYPLEHCNQNGRSALSLTLTPHYHQDSTIRLLDAGAQPHAHGADKDGTVHTPYDAATQQMNGDALYLLNQYAETPSLAQLRHEDILTADSTVLQHPHGWRNFRHIAETLAAQGTPLSKEDLLTPYHEQRCFLTRAAECNHLPQALTYLHGRDETLTPQDLLDSEGKPNALLTTCIERQCAGAVMTYDNWKHQGREAMEAVWRALPPEGRAQCRNYFSLRAQLSGQERGQAQGR